MQKRGPENRSKAQNKCQNSVMPLQQRNISWSDPGPTPVLGGFNLSPRAAPLPIRWGRLKRRRCSTEYSRLSSWLWPDGIRGRCRPNASASGRRAARKGGATALGLGRNSREVALSLPFPFVIDLSFSSLHRAKKESNRFRPLARGEEPGGRRWADNVHLHLRTSKAGRVKALCSCKGRIVKGV